MPVIVYNTRYDTQYRNAEEAIPQLFELPLNYADKPVYASEPMPDTRNIKPKSNMEKYFFMGVIVIGLAIVLNKLKI